MSTKCCLAPWFMWVYDQEGSDSDSDNEYMPIEEMSHFIDVPVRLHEDIPIGIKPKEILYCKNAMFNRSYEAECRGILTFEQLMVWQDSCLRYYQDSLTKVDRTQFNKFIECGKVWLIHVNHYSTCEKLSESQQKNLIEAIWFWYEYLAKVWNTYFFNPHRNPFANIRITRQPKPIEIRAIGSPPTPPPTPPNDNTLARDLQLSNLLQKLEVASHEFEDDERETELINKKKQRQ